MFPFPATSYPDLITVYDLSDDVDSQNTPDLNTRGTALVTDLPAAVQKTQTTSQGTRYVTDESPHGYAQYEICTKVDPLIARANQQIVWTKNAAGVFATPIVLMATGQAKPANGIGVRWATSAELRT